jgi:hypothetical protein
MNRLATNIIPKLLCLALVLALPCAAQYGPAPTYVGIPSFMFTPAAQQQDEWCWAASIQMILNWYHIPVTQEMIVNQIKGAPIPLRTGQWRPRISPKRRPRWRDPRSSCVRQSPPHRNPANPSSASIFLTLFCPYGE